MSSFAHDCHINTVTGELTFNGKCTILRPKTFELLVLLARTPQHVFSKSEILASVWQGTVVEEQVIFQSINEIRKATGHADIIKTYPRRGYRWEVANTSFVEDRITNNAEVPRQESSLPQASKAVQPPVNKNPTRYIVLATCIVALLAFLIVDNVDFSQSTSSTFQNETSRSPFSSQEHSGILVLPFNVQSLNSDRQWLRYGAMEGLINQLTPSADTTVFHVEDVIEILNRLPKADQKSTEHIFAQSGAAYILETSISGSPGDLNVIYTIYNRTSRTTRALKVTSIESAIRTLAGVFEQIYQDRNSGSDKQFETQLQNELIAKAMKFLEVDDNQSALAFIESAVINQPDNIVALYFSVKINLILGNAEKSLALANQALALNASDLLNKYIHRLRYYRALAHLSLGKMDKADNDLAIVEQLSSKNKDWLYFAYTQSIIGKLRQHQERFDEAYTRFNTALKYQELLKCPFGVVQGHLDLAEFHLRNNDKTLAQQNFNTAESMIKEKKLNKALPLLNQVRQSF